MSAALNIAPQQNVGAADLALESADFNAIAGIVREACGIQLNESKRGLVKSRLQKRVRVNGLSGFSEYVEFIRTPAGESELEELICAISTNVTAFNREAHHFAHFKESVLPNLLNRVKTGEPVRIWSAGCSNGSEPYTIACLVLDALPDAVRHNIRILATDIDRYSLDTGRAGHYPPDMTSKLEPQTLKKWFTPTERGHQIHDQPRELVSFKTLNLMAPWPMKMSYDVIFCRNVLIYFSQQDQERLFDKFSQHLKPGGTFYIGHSERIAGVASDKFHSVGPTSYSFQPGGAAR